MELDESEKALKVQEKEKVYGGMNVHYLMVRAKKFGVSVQGNKGAIVQHLLDKKMTDQLFEEAIES